MDGCGGVPAITTTFHGGGGDRPPNSPPSMRPSWLERFGGAATASGRRGSISGFDAGALTPPAFASNHDESSNDGMGVTKMFSGLGDYLSVKLAGANPSSSQGSNSNQEIKGPTELN